MASRPRPPHSVTHYSCSHGQSSAWLDHVPHALGTAEALLYPVDLVGVQTKQGP